MSVGLVVSVFDAYYTLSLGLIVANSQGYHSYQTGSRLVLLRNFYPFSSEYFLIFFKAYNLTFMSSSKDAWTH